MSKLSESQRRDLEVIKHPETWPKRPVLGLSRTREGDESWDWEDLPEVGFIVESPDYPNCIVFQQHVDVFSEVLSGRGELGVLHTLSRKVYPSATAMILDGWTVQ